MKKLISFFAIILTIFVFGCSKSESELNLISYGPEVHAKKDFNLQAGGENAIWMKIEGGVGGDTIAVIDDLFLYDTSIQNEGKTATTIIPKKFYEIAGTHKLYLISKKSKTKSKEIDFVVLP
jgi:hypothetical protein